MKQSHDVPTEFLGRTRGERCIQIVRYGEKAADDIIRLELIGLDQSAEELVRGGKNLRCIVTGDGGGAPYSLESNRGWHGR